MKNKSESAVIFTDGSSRGNPGPGGWGAVILQGEHVKELGGGNSHTTNNQMELMAAIEALGAVPEATEVELLTDSSYLISGITKWVHGWQRNGWITTQKEEVTNRDLWEALISVVEGKKVRWNHVGGHVGIPGNERCDEIATAYADNKKIVLYGGLVTAYDRDLSITKGDTTLAAKKSASRSRSGAKAYSYLSFLDGVLIRHATWPECEARVKGKRGARFKKALSADDEDLIKKEWGVV